MGSVERESRKGGNICKALEILTGLVVDKHPSCLNVGNATIKTGVLYMMHIKQYPCNLCSPDFTFFTLAKEPLTS
jgi:hypothetical protein